MIGVPKPRAISSRELMYFVLSPKRPISLYNKIGSSGKVPVNPNLYLVSNSDVAISDETSPAFLCTSSLMMTSYLIDLLSSSLY